MVKNIVDTIASTREMIATRHVILTTSLYNVSNTLILTHNRLCDSLTLQVYQQNDSLQEISKESDSFAVN